MVRAAVALMLSIALIGVLVGTTVHAAPSLTERLPRPGVLQAGAGLGSPLTVETGLLTPRLLPADVDLAGEFVGPTSDLADGAGEVVNEPAVSWLPAVAADDEAAVMLPWTLLSGLLAVGLLLSTLVRRLAARQVRPA